MPGLWSAGDMVCARQAPLSTQLHCQPLRHSNPLIFLICGCLNALISIGPIEPEDIIGIKSEHAMFFFLLPIQELALTLPLL